MTKPVVITARIDTVTSQGLDRLSVDADRSRAWLIAEAVRKYVEQELAFSAFLQEGLDAVERGDVISHDELIANIKARYAHKQAA